MNAVTLTIVVSRATPNQCRIAVSREGAGDDMVEERADAVEKILRRFASALVKRDGGPFEKGEER